MTNLQELPIAPVFVEARVLTTLALVRAFNSASDSVRAHISVGTEYIQSYKEDNPKWEGTFAWPCRFHGELLSGTVTHGGDTFTGPCEITLMPCTVWRVCSAAVLRGKVFKDTSKGRSAVRTHTP